MTGGRPRDPTKTEGAAGGAGLARGPRSAPGGSVALAAGATGPLVAGALFAWFGGPLLSALAVNLSVLWGGVVLVFLAGARHGAGSGASIGSTAARTGTVLWLLILGFGALLSPTVPVTPVAVGPHVPSFALLLLGYASLMVLDPLAASRGEVPAHLAWLRPVQMAIAVLALAVLLARTL